MVLNPELLVTAFITGLLSTVHCVGMCGGIVGILSMSTQHSRSPWLLIISYNLGRLGSYSVAGAVVGGLGSTVVNLSQLHQLQLVLQFGAALLMIAVGLYLAGWWQGLLRLERLGGHLWRRIEPYGRRFLPPKHPLQALALGALWGWLPCGLVYSWLISALSTGGAFAGAVLLLCFGLGTLPLLLTLGGLGHSLSIWLRHPQVRQVAGGIVIVLALVQLWRGVL